MNNALARSCLYLAVLLVCLSAAITATAADTSTLLPVDKAFAPKVSRDGPHTLSVSWQIADGYYLYRHAFAFALQDAGDARLGPPTIPEGNRHTDEYFGPVETYRHTVHIRIPVQGDLPSTARLAVSYQGCADAGLCYPPQEKTRPIPDDVSATATANAGPPENARDITQTARTAARLASRAGGETTTTQPSNADTTTTLAERLANAPHVATLGLFLLLGLGLAFTPCILPMIPIVAGLIGSRDVSRARAFALALAYVIAMAVAYAVFGVVAGYFGANIQAALQRPLVLLPFAGLFLLLAGASFGWFDFQMPGALRARLSGPETTNSRSLAGAAGLGFAAALIAGPCVAPPLAGALLYISTSGNILLGGLALFCLGLGMGLPLIALAVFGASVLPRTGAWMAEIRVFFGVLLLATGFYLGLRLAPAAVALAAWGGLALVYGAYLSTRPVSRTSLLVSRRVAVALLGGYVALAMAGLAIGNGRPTAPLAGLASTSDPTGAAASKSPFERVTTQAGLKRALARARETNRAAMVDVYADWCVECVRMKHTVFARPAVRTALTDIVAIEFDITDYTADQRQALRAMSIFGPPTLVFYRADGDTNPDARVTGTIDAETLLGRLGGLDNTARTP
ncbi:protein-disulfide reductase DsbD [Salinisphaera sp. Q1T1-3]|uniref:protein-disulfide reductase DsbD n=1 Tax=Salinisphaera sp. Q1T1-3 TaxID=2321229 RepID=UPI0013142DB6|nr:protein-disulfide reductase DsbD [Salinisphaera sp. Q1T1-3]